MVTGVWDSGIGVGAPDHAISRKLFPELVPSASCRRTLPKFFFDAWIFLLCGKVRVFSFWRQDSRFLVLPTYNCVIRSGQNGCDYQFPGYCVRLVAIPTTFKHFLAPVNQAAREYFKNKI